MFVSLACEMAEAVRVTPPQLWPPAWVKPGLGFTQILLPDEANAPRGKAAVEQFRGSPLCGSVFPRSALLQELSGAFKQMLLCVVLSTR